MDEATLCFTPVEKLAPLIRDGKVSSVEATEAALARLERLEPKLNAFVTVMSASARAAAKQADAEIKAGQWRGHWHGVPITLKDLYDTNGVKTTAASRILATRVPDRDATVTTRLNTAGAVLLGKNNMAEFAYGHIHMDYGPSHNPWNLDHFTGGSSSGSGAAVACGIGQMSMGSDTGGSIRSPASNCGIVGIKATYGLVPRTNVAPLSWSLDHCGPMTRTVWDCAAALQVVAGYDPADPGSADRPTPDFLANIDGGVAGLRLGVPRNHLGEDIHPDIAAAFERAVADLVKLGARLVDVNLPDYAAMSVANLTILAAEAASIHEKWFYERPEDYSPAVRERLEVGLAMSGVDFLRAQRARRELCAQLAAAMANIDLLVMPSSPILPSRIEDVLAMRMTSARPDPMLRRTRFTAPYNLTGLPAISIPMGFSSDGLPMGLQLVGHAWQEPTVFRAARAFERAQPWHERRPPIAV